MSLLTQAILSGIVLGATYVLVSIGLSLIFGVMDVINFAHGSLLTLGAYATYWLVQFQIPVVSNPYVTLLITIPLLFLVGAVIQKYLINRVMNDSPINQLLLTVGIFTVLDATYGMLWGPTPRSINVPAADMVFEIIGARITLAEILALVGAAVFTGGLFLMLYATKWGKMMRASANDKTGAEVCGIDVDRVHVVAFGVGTALVGAAGTLLAPQYAIRPLFGTAYLLIAFVVVVLGGLGSLRGAVVGGLILGLVQSLTAAYFPSTWKLMVAMAILLGVLLIKPEGLFGNMQEEVR
jgi:branched-chain amino acid transport system permease protein